MDHIPIISPVLNYLMRFFNSDALHKAVKNGDIQKIQNLIDKGYNVNSPDPHGITPLLYSIEMQNPNIVNLLIQNGADVNVKAKNGEDPLFYAVVTEKPDIAIIQLLVKSGANVNINDNTGLGPLLSWAIISQKSASLINILIQNGADVNAKSKMGYTPLYYALDLKKADIVDLLLQNGANPNFQDHEGKTYLHITSDAELAKILIKYGAKLDIKDKHGRTPCENNRKLLNILSSENQNQIDQEEVELVGAEEMFRKFGELTGHFEG